MDNTDSFMFGLIAGFVLTFIMALGFMVPSFEDDIYEAWCKSDGGRWVDSKCFDEYKEHKLK